MPNEIGRNTVSDQIVNFAIDTQNEDLPRTALQILSLSLADWVSVTIAGAGEPVAKIASALVEREGGAEESYALGLPRRVPARAAALVNGACGHALDYDDTHFVSLGHPSVVVLPAAMAVSNLVGASHKQFKTAALIGMEIAVRTGAWLGRNHYRAGFHVTATAGTFGATMAVARLLGLSSQQAHHALGIATSRAAGVKAQFGSMGKPMHAGFAASNGVEAALLAQLGFTAGACALESSQGFAESHHGEYDDTALSGIGQQFLFEEISHKYHACCHGTHAAMEALLSICDIHQVKPDAVKSIDISVHPQYLDICNIVSPMTGLEAKFSYHMVAALVLHGHDTARMDTFNDSICRNSTLQKTHDCVQVHTNPALAETGAEVTVSLSNGNTLRESHDLLAPVDFPRRECRVRAKSESILGSRKATDLWSNVATGNILPSQWMKDYFRH